MAVNKLVFGGVDSSTYGIYISGEGVFNAPKRAVEMIEIPGRNGSFALDQGRFENITVTYPAFTYETSMATFQQNLANFRNALASKKGYQRLTDTFHTDEYRMAVFKDGFDVKPVKYNTASQFDITFECKPQRWLTSGETATAVASGGTLSNPTPFEAGPLLEVKGYGTIEFNGYEIELANALMGDTVIENDGSMQGIYHFNGSSGNTARIDLYPNSFNIGDTIMCGAVQMTAVIKVSPLGTHVISSIEPTGSGYNILSAVPDGAGNYNVTINCTSTSGIFTSGNSTTTRLFDQTLGLKVNYADSTSNISNPYFDVFTRWSNSINAQLFLMSVDVLDSLTDVTSAVFKYGAIRADSTISILGNPTYIDCDLGEAYLINNGAVVSLNKYIDLGSDLPKLASGTNTITFDNTITELKVAPRWWKV